MSFFRQRRQDPTAIHVLIATLDVARSARLTSLIGAAMPTVLDVVDDLAEATAALGEGIYDLILADVDLPGFQDPMLLRLARDAQPLAVRVALLDRPRRDVTLATLAHLAVLPEELDDGFADRLRRAMALQRAISDPVVRAQIARCEALPATPALYGQLATVLASDDVSVMVIAEVVAQDAEIVARILQLVNSAFLGRAQPTADLADAIAYLGISTVRAMVLQLEVIRSFRQHTDPSVGQLADRLSAHGLDVAGIARVVMPRATEAYAAGLLHDLGKLVLAGADPEAYARVEAQVTGGRRPRDAEQEIFDCGHDVVGGAVLASWGLPTGLVEAVACHHSPAELGETLSLAGAVHIADALSYGENATGKLDREWVQATGLTGHLDEWSHALELQTS